MVFRRPLSVSGQVAAVLPFVKQAAIVNHIQAASCSADKKNIDSLEDTSMHLIRALSIIFGFLALGEAVIHFTGMKLPGSIIGMALLFVSLHMKWVKAAWLQGLVDVMMANLSLFLVPPCVAVMGYFDLLAEDFWAIAASTLLSTLAVMFATGKTHELLRRR